MMRRPLLLGVALLSAAALVAGCGGSVASAGHSTTPTPAATAPPAGLKVTTTEFAFHPSTLTASAGKVRLTLVNPGKVVHELVVLKTAQATDALKVSGGRVSEEHAVGEVSETPAGATKSATLTLKPGHYVYVCNIPGHYMSGMRGTLTVR